MNELLAEFLRGYTATNQWAALLPEILMALLALGLLGFEMIATKACRSSVCRVAIWGQVVILVVTFASCGWAGLEPRTLFAGMIEQTDVSHIMRGFFLISSILVCYLGGLFLGKNSLARTEFYHLVVVIAAAMMLLVQSSNFVMLFVALETVTVAFYVLVAYYRTSSLSLEAGLKYLILGALSSSILLFGIVLLYGAGGNPALPGSGGDALGFAALAEFIALNPDNAVVKAGALFVIAGICFKIGAVPFQIWVPDVYQGAPTPVTAYLAVASKAAGFIVLLELVTGPFAALQDFLVPVLSAIAIITILFGNVAAVTQRNVKRLMGLSGIAHAGYMLVGVVAAFYVDWAVYAVIFYLVTYLLASFAVFGVMSLVAGPADADQELEHYQDIARRHPFLGGVLTAGLGSLAGIPPLGGFIGKLFLFIAAFQAGLYTLLLVSVVGVVISIYYYFGWIREAYFGDARPEENTGTDPTPFADQFVLGSLVLVTVFIGLFPALFPIIP